MTPFDHLLIPEDDLDRQFVIALEGQPEEERAIRRAIWSMVRNMERQIDGMSADVRDCNVTMARIIDKAVRFEAGCPSMLDGETC